MQPTSPLGPLAWIERYCPSLDGQFLFLDPLRWDTHLLSAGAVIVLPVWFVMRLFNMRGAK